MNVIKATMLRMRRVLPKRWLEPAKSPKVAPLDTFEPQAVKSPRRRAPTIDWAEVDSSLPRGDALQVMDQVLGPSLRYGLAFNTSSSEDPLIAPGASQVSLTCKVPNDI